LPDSKGRTAAPLALVTGQPQVGDIVINPLDGKTPLVAIAMPVLREGRPTRLLLTTLETSHFQESLASVALPADWSLALQDGTGADIARHAPAGFDAGGDVDADRRFVVPLQHSAWRVVLEIPRASQRAQQMRSLAWLAAAIALAVLAGLLGGTLAGRRLSRAVQALAEGKEEAAASEFSEVARAWQRLEQTRSAWHSSETHFRQLYDRSPLPLVLVAGDGRVLALNRRFREVLGYSAEDLPDAAAWFARAYPDPALRARAQATWQTASGGGDIGPREHRVTTKDGDERDMLISSILLPEGALAIFIDVTEQRRQEARIRLWAEAFERSQLSVAIADARSNSFVMVNPAFAQERGYRPDELAGQPISSLFPADAFAAFRPKLAGLDASGHGVFESEHLHKDGRRFPVWLDITVIHDADGRAQYRIAYALDLTERRRAEAELAAVQAAALQTREQARSEERRVGKECRRLCRSRWSPYH
jgi:PAS domain S-box-containing protein